MFNDDMKFNNPETQAQFESAIQAFAQQMAEIYAREGHEDMATQIQFRWKMLSSAEMAFLENYARILMTEKKR